MTTAARISKPARSRKVTKSWRDVLKIHLAALEYPRPGEDEFRELGKDIAARGMQVNIVLIREGDKDLLLDGISRLDALEANGVNLIANDKLDPTLGLGGGPRVRVVTGVDPYALAASLNAHRRHLTLEQKRERIEALIKQNPERSDNATAKIAKVSDKTVTQVRKELEGRSEIPNVSKRTDTKGRRQPARKQRSSSKSNDIGKMPLLKAAVAFVDATNSAGEQTKAAVFAPATADDSVRLQERIGELEDENQQLKIKLGGAQSEIAELKAARPATLFDALRAALAIAEREGASAALRRGIQNMIADLTKLPPDDLAFPEILRRH
jgi:hypothetical protein